MSRTAGPLQPSYNPEERAGSTGAVPAVEEESGSRAIRRRRTSSPPTSVMGRVSSLDDLGSALRQTCAKNAN